MIFLLSVAVDFADDLPASPPEVNMVRMIGSFGVFFLHPCFPRLSPDKIITALDLGQ
jgi:hypothetical protein